LLGDRIPEKVSGSDLLEPLAAMAAERGYKVFLLGGAAGVGEAAAEKLRRKHPGLRIVGIESPTIDLDQPLPTGLLRRIRQSRAQILLVAFGAPKQELFIHAATPALGSCVAIGVGASLDFVAGRVKRAPGWMSRSGLEWLYRLAREPRRLWRRYLMQDPLFAVIVLAQVLRLHRRGPRADAPSLGQRAGELMKRGFTQLRWRNKHLLDLGVVVACVLGASLLDRPGVWPGLDTLWLAGALAALWVLATTLMRHYDLSRRRSSIDDIAIVSLLALLLNGAMSLAGLVLKRPDVVSGAHPFLTLFWPAALIVRLFYNRNRYRPDHAPEIEEIVVLGTSPLARITKETMEARPDAVVLGFIPMRSDGQRQVRGP